MRPIFVRQIVGALSSDVAEGPVFYATAMGVFGSGMV